ncbi:MAG: ABC transporter substrate-binding protein [Anaerolineae bacterium]|nr:ABC transporter substrate-binding protein [Anaerolineae bacterium]
MKANGSRMIIAAVLVLLLVGISNVTYAQGGTLRVGINAPEVLDPALGSADSEIMFNRNIYDYLIEILPDGNLAPNLAQTWDVSEDGLTYTFQLVGGVTFHDGSPFTAADVAFTFIRLKEVESPALGLLRDYEVAADGDLTVVFTLPEINADFLYGVGSNFAPILKDGTSEPNVLVEGDNPYVNFNGTGPFVLTDYRPGESATLTANGSYWREGEPKLSSLELLYIDDPLAQIDAIRSGAVDVIFRVPLDQLATLESEASIQVIQKTTNLHPVVRLRSDEGHLGADVRIREAFKAATDRNAINDLLLDGLGTVANNDPIGPVYGPFYHELPQPAHDPAHACELIQEATGQERLSGLTFYVVDAFNYADVGTVLQQQWAEGCIDVDVQVRAENIYYGSNEWLEVDLGLTGWGHRVVPQDYLAQAYVSDGPFNEAHWSTPELDALVAEAARTPDMAARSSIYEQIEEIFAAEGPIIIPFFTPVVGAVVNGVEGLNMHTFPGRTDFRSVTVTG